jgi:DNA polymerase elongation subunit (family B)
MYQNIFIDKKENVVHLWDDEKGYVTFPFRNYAYRKSPNGIYRSIYGDKLEKVYNFNPRDPSLFESDVPMETRILIDAYEDSDEPSKGHRVVTIDIEVSSEGGFPVIEEGDKEITAIAIYDDATKQYTAFILDKEMKLKDSVSDGVEIKSYDNEESLLMHFFTKWEEIQPTIVTGWNIDNFDMVYLYNRAKRVVGETNAKRLSPIGICYFNKFLERMSIAGVSCLDYMILYKKFSGKNEPSYALGAIGKKVVNIDKISYKGSLNDLYKEDINKYIEYNLNDVKIVVALDKKLQFIDLARGICHTGHVGYENFGMSSRFLEGAILIYLRRKKQVAPNKSLEGRAEYENQLEQNEEGFEGAYVKDPIPGRYDWVFDLDLTSMYPNIIISLNISPETKVGKVDNWNVEEYVKNGLNSIYISGTPYTPSDFKSMLTENNFSIASNGVLYKKPGESGEMGTIPSILVKWFDERKNLRKLAKKHADLKEWEKYEFYDNRQKIQKILLNSIYGCLGLPVFRFYDKDNAEAVTLTGVDIIKTAGKSINQYYKTVLKEDGDYLIYTDTDSCFASALPIIQKTMPDIDLKNEEQMTHAILKVCGEVQTFVNQMFDVMADRMFNVQKHRFDAKQEVIAKTSFWLAKKRYAQFIINKGGVVCDELEVKGIDVVRTSFPAKFRTFMHGFLIDLLKKVEKETIDKNILDFKESIKTLNVIDIAKNTSVKFSSQDKTKVYDSNKRPAFKFVSGTPAQAKAALAYNDLLVKWNLVKSVPKILHGQKIKWVYMKQNEYGIEGLAMKADGTDPDQIMDFILKYVDREAMYEQELKSKLEDFYKVLGWDYPNENDAKASEFFGF